MRKIFAGKKGTKKKGVILLTVVFILAVALIFIVSALTLTTATRSRLYEHAFENQARLTVTSVAESFYQALMAQEIPDSTITGLIGKTINVTGSMPGMTGDPDNYTTAEFSRVGGGVKIHFTTRIGDSIECCDMILKSTPPERTPSGFSRQLTLGNGANLVRTNVGYDLSGGRYDSSENIVFSYGDIQDDHGSINIYSDFISLGTFFSDGNTFYGDAVFIGSDAGYGIADSNLNFADSDTGTAYFINCDNAFYYKNSTSVTPITTSNVSSNDYARSRSYTNGTLVFYNCDNVTLGGNAIGNAEAVYYYDNVDSFNFSGEDEDDIIDMIAEGDDEDIDTKISDYIGMYDSLYDEDGNLIDQATPDAWDEVASELNWSSRTFTSMSVNKPTGEYDVTPGNYKISGTMGGMDVAPVFNIDLSAGDYTFYINDNLSIEGGMFRVINGAPNSYKCTFVIAKDKYLEIGINNSHNVCGIVSANCFPSVALDNDGTGYTYANLNQNISPCVFIYSMGATVGTELNDPARYATGGDSTANLGQIRLSSSSGMSKLVAYVGLYPSTDGAGDGGALTVTDGGSAMVFGRIEANAIGAARGSNLNLPYCVEPNHDTPMVPFQAINSQYELYDFQYYSVAVSTPS
ncbi:MAG: hypothetical protein IJ869_05400 [Clostridiales bacterium]|nr:hypothetical protein [Clostridiales bacterium]